MDVLGTGKRRDFGVGGGGRRRRRGGGREMESFLHGYITDFRFSGHRRRKFEGFSINFCVRKVGEDKEIFYQKSGTGSFSLE